jgi:pilus assembly protein CpaE
MSRHPASGTLGNVQLLVFAGAASAEPARVAAAELGFTTTRIETGSAVEAAAFLAQHPSPEILLVEVSNAEEAPAQLDALADMVNLYTKVLVTGTIDSIRFYQWLSDLGIDGYLLQPFTAGELKQAIAKGSMKKTQAAQAVAAADPAPIICMIGAHGGVGTTTIATNLAAIIAKEYKRPTALIDLDPYFGSAALAFDLLPGRGLRDALEKPDRVDALFLERVMVKPFEHLAILSAEEPLSDVLVPQANAGEMILAALREKFRTIIIDMPRQLNPLTRYLLTQTDFTYIVAEPQLASIRDAMRIKDLVVDSYKRALPKIILSRTGMSSAHELSAKEFAKSYGEEAVATVPFQPEIMATNALGELISAQGKTANAHAAIAGIARSIIGDVAKSDGEMTVPSRSLLSRLKGGK